MKYQTFIFKDYSFSVDTRKLTLKYSYDNALDFSETYTFDFPFTNYDPVLLDRALQMVFFMTGISYYKAYLAPEIRIEKGSLDNKTVAFFSQTYQKGLGEFFYVNNLDPNTPISFPVNNLVNNDPVAPVPTGYLIGIGGGKDSLLSVKLLQNSVERLATWSLGHKSQLSPLIERIGLPHFWVERDWDKKLLEINKEDALNGHVPISALFACVGTVVGILAGYSDALVSNEQSANEPTLTYRNVEINHQYSKSLEFEQSYQELLKSYVGGNTNYYSLLRPLSELRISELFAHNGFEKYKDVFSSCNKAFTTGIDHIFWDGTCPKCAFVFLALTPFISREQLEQLFGGKNLLLDNNLMPIYKQLLGIEGDKPLECVGEIKESRAAMRLAQEIYPELGNMYSFDLPNDYNFRSLGSHSMPEPIFEIIKQKLTS